jgi:hypothetical protein
VRMWRPPWRLRVGVQGGDFDFFRGLGIWDPGLKMLG